MKGLNEEQQAELDACKQYMHEDSNNNDERIWNEFMPAAKAYLAGAGIHEPDGSDVLASALYQLAFHSLTLHYYDHRDAVDGEAPIPIGLRPIINQLKHSGPGCI